LVKESISGIDEMVASLRAAHGGRLRTIVLYGSAATAQKVSPTSDINLLVVVDEIILSALERLAPDVVKWAEAGNPPPLTFTVDEWHRSADVYPMEYLDVLEEHRVLAGDLSIVDTEVDMAHLRLQLEQEFMGKLLAMRQGMMLSAANADSRGVLLEVAARKIMVLLRGLVRLHAERPPHAKGELVARASRLAAVDCSVFLRVYEEVTTKGGFTAARSSALVRDMVVALDEVSVHVNKFVPDVKYRAGIPSAEPGRSK
jgi:predicted nucleotidyltransferase